MTKAELVTALLAVTPRPPAVDDHELMGAAADLLAARDAVLAAAPRVGASAVNPAEVDELVARQLAWDTALAAARDRLGAQRIGAGRMRRYAGR
ncbi:MAG TPA: hypothetical protein VGM88_26290 [Kofleriaceae bacterium]